jgi:hypothetical protein
LKGLLGNWRPYKSWVYSGERYPSAFASGGTTNIRKDGTFKTFEPFYAFSSSKDKFVPDHNNPKWINASTSTKYNSRGAELENVDASGIYSAALYGYNEHLMKAMAKNAMAQQIAFDGFEDYAYNSSCTVSCAQNGFDFKDQLSVDEVVVDTVSHSGLNSLYVKHGNTVDFAGEIKAHNDPPGVTYNSDSLSYLLNANGCLPGFSPVPGEYFASAWIHQDGSCEGGSFSNGKIIISFTDSSLSSIGSTYTFLPSGNIIEGWQRVAGTFTVPNGAKFIHVQLQAISGSINAFFDDVRIQPFNSSMTCYVHDPLNLRLTATLDENNYATFYEYDEAGSLVRVKKETERGIMTIQEGRQSMKQQ